MYHFGWGVPPLPDGSFATHPAHAVFHEFFIVVTSLDLLLQAYTIYLELRVAKRELNEYRYFMMLSTTCDICLAVSLGFIVQPRLHGPLFSCISARGLASVFGHEGARISMILAYTFGAALVASQAYCMIYRVTAVHENPSLKRRFLSAPVVAMRMLLMAGLIAGVSYAIHITTMRDTDDIYDGRALANKKTRSRDQLFDATMLASSKTFTADGKIIWKNRMLSPFITLLGPVVYLIGGQFGFYKTSVGALYTCVAGISVFPMLNAILTITFVGPYRRFTTKWIRAAFKGDFGADSALQSAAIPTPDEDARRRSTLISIKGIVRAALNRRRTIFANAGNAIHPLT